MSKEDYRLQLDEYGFEASSEFGWPRAFGSSCVQFIVESYDELFHNLLLTMASRKGAFISISSYPWLKRKSGGGFVPQIVRAQVIIHDLDSKNKLENSLRELRRLSYIADSLHISWIASFSGGKGFHFYFELSPQSYWFLHTNTSASSLKELVGCLQNFLVEQAELETYDTKIICDVRRIIRLPWSLYVNSKGETNGRYCVPLTREQVQTWNIEQIIYLSEHPTFELVRASSGYLFEMEEIIPFLEAKKYRKPSLVTQLEVNRVPIDDDIVNDILMLLKQDEVFCIVDQLRSRNPDHKARYFLIAWLKRYYGLKIENLQEVIAIYDRFAVGYNYDDFWNVPCKNYQVENVLQNDNYLPQGCPQLQKDGLCLGSSCPKYHD